MFKGNRTAVAMNTANSGKAFEDARRHGADGTIPQATGLSEASSWCGDNHYESERMHAGRKNGMFIPETIGKRKKLDFGRGHIFERPVAEVNALIMSLDSGFEIEVIDASKEEWRNDAWPSHAAHLDFFLKIKKGRAIPNPDFVIGGPEKNFKIIPDTKDHIYIADSKTVRSGFVNAWSEKDENGIPIGGMANGIAPTSYRQQQLGYCGICHIEGAFLLAHKGGYDEYDFAQVFIPYDKEEAEAILDECERRNQESYHGIIPSVRECKDVGLAISELPLQFPDVNIGKKELELDAAKWKVSMDRIVEIDGRLKEVNEQLKPLITEFKNKVFDELGEKVANSISVDTKETKSLKEEKKLLIALPLEEVQDGPGCFYKDPDSGMVVRISYSAGVKWDDNAKKAIAEDYPEVYEDLRHRFPERKPKYTRTVESK